jgi:hypothetical protein
VILRTRSFTFRDLAVLNILGRGTLVAACDAVGGLGAKPDDVEWMDPECVGYFSARVVLVELLSMRATPIMAMCSFCVELNPTAVRLLAGVKQQLREEGLENVLMINSTETNFSTKHTAMGIVMLGRCKRWSQPRVELGDVLYRVGTPRVGLKVGDPDILPIAVVRQAVRTRGVHEVIPLGSRGARAEIDELTRRGVEVAVDSVVEQSELDRSAGPANAFLMLVRPDSQGACDLISLLSDQHVIKLGTVRAMNIQPRPEELP